jgi:hypothetical protein
VSPARPGAFNANFAPDTLDAFKTLCREQGKKYTKVLEEFAVLYLKSNGTILETMSVPSSLRAEEDDAGKTKQELLEIQNLKIVERLERVESDDREFVNAFEILIQRVEALEQKLGGNGEEPKHHPRKS